MNITTNWSIKKENWAFDGIFLIIFCPFSGFKVASLEARYSIDEGQEGSEVATQTT